MLLTSGHGLYLLGLYGILPASTLLSSDTGPSAPNLVKIDKKEGDEREGFLRSHDKEEDKENIQQNF